MIILALVNWACKVSVPTIAPSSMMLIKAEQFRTERTISKQTPKIGGWDISIFYNLMKFTYTIIVMICRLIWNSKDLVKYNLFIIRHHFQMQKQSLYLITGNVLLPFMQVKKL